MEAWYQRDGLLTYTATYRTVAAWRAEQEAASVYGWSTRSQHPRPNKQGQYVIHYTRSASAEGSARVYGAAQHLSLTSTSLAPHDHAQLEAQQQLRQQIERTRTDDSFDPVQLERQLLQRAQRLVQQSQVTQQALRAHVAALARAEAAHVHAAAVRAKVAPSPLDFRTEQAQYSTRVRAGEEELRFAQVLQGVQDNVVRAVKAWQTAVGERWEVTHHLAALEQQVAAVTAHVEVTRQNAAAQRWRGLIRRFVEWRVTRARPRLHVLQRLVPERERALVQTLQARDTAFARLDAVTGGHQ